MCPDLNQDPEGLRREGRSSHARASELYGWADTGLAWEDREYLRRKFGNAAEAAIGNIILYRRQRKTGITSAADGRRGVGDACYTGATEFEIADDEGAVGVRRATPRDP